MEPPVPRPYFKSEIIAVLTESDYKIPNKPFQQMTAGMMIAVIKKEKSCLKTSEWAVCPVKVKASKQCLVNRINAISQERFGLDSWVRYCKRIDKKYLVDYLYSLRSNDAVFYGNPYTKIPRRLKKARKIQLPPQLQIPIIAPRDPKLDAETLFNTFGNYFDIVPNFTYEDWRDASLGRAKERCKVIQHLSVLHRLKAALLN